VENRWVKGLETGKLMKNGYGEGEGGGEDKKALAMDSDI
jgi:hypothetical protein